MSAARLVAALGMLGALSCASTPAPDDSGPTAAQAAAKAAQQPAPAREGLRVHGGAAPQDELSKQLPKKLRGVVQEVTQSGGYTYVRILRDDDNTELWAAVAEVELKAGDRVTIRKDVVMRHFYSRSLERTFDAIVFGEVEGEIEHGAAPPADALSL